MAEVSARPRAMAARVRSGGRFDCDGFKLVHPKYEDPWPLSDKYFLCSRTTGNPDDDEQMGIYLVDVFDTVTEVARIDGHSLLEPIPLAHRQKPPADARPEVTCAAEHENLFVGVHVAASPTPPISRLPACRHGSE